MLNRLFEIATEEGRLSPLRGRHARLRLSLYADDAVIFTNPKREDVSCIMDIMQAFGDATGLKIKIEKSTVAPIRCEPVDLDHVLVDFAGARVGFPVRYLGLPLTLRRIRMVHLQYILDKAKGKMQGWQGTMISIVGRRELIKSVITAQPVYLMSVIKPPKQFIKEFDKMRRRFLWAGDGEINGGKCKVAWPRVCQPMENGGLGIKDFETFSRSLRLRWLWYAWDDRDRPWKDLPTPTDIADMMLFNEATTVDLGNGKKASFWNSSSLHGKAPAVLFPALYKHSKRKNRTVLEAMSGNRWISDVDHNMTLETISQFVSLWETMQGWS